MESQALPVMDDDGYTLFDLETHEALATQEEMEADQGLPWLDERRQKARERDAILGRSSRAYATGVQKEWLSQTVDSREAVARIAKELEVPGDHIGVMIQDSQLYVRGLMSLPVDEVRALGVDGFKACHGILWRRGRRPDEVGRVPRLLQAARC